jgi:hypothetical protein
MRTNLERLGVHLSLLALLLAACGGDSGTRTRADTDDDTADTGDDQGTGDQGTDDQGTDDQGTDDQGTGDQGTDDQGTGDQGTGDQGDDINVIECTLDFDTLELPTFYDDGSGGQREVRLVLRAVDFHNDITYLQNISESAIDFDENWRIAYNAATADLLTSAVTLPAGATLRVHHSASGTHTVSDFFIGRTNDFGNLTACGGELVVQYDPDAITAGGWSNRPQNIEAFVRWGNRSTPGASSTFTDAAFSAGAWTKNWTASTSDAGADTCWTAHEGVSWCQGVTPTCSAGTPNDEALIATGDMRDPAGWEAADAGDLAPCF